MSLALPLTPARGSSPQLQGVGCGADQEPLRLRPGRATEREATEAVLALSPEGKAFGLRKQR